MCLSGCFINDPSDHADQGVETTQKEKKERKRNVVIKANGLAYATKTIDIDKELHTNYQRD